MIDAAQNLEKGGADFILLCTNTMHKVSEEIENNITIPFLHIVDATAEIINQKSLKKSRINSNTIFYGRRFST